MQLKSLHWLSHHGIRVITSCTTNMVSVPVRIFYFGGVFVNKTIITLALVEYEMITSNPALRVSTAIVGYLSYPGKTTILFSSGKILFLTLENKIHIFKPPCNFLFTIETN